MVLGANGLGQVGDGTIDNRVSPTQVAGTTWDDVETGGLHTCATTTSGTARCRGENDIGQLGVGRPGIGATADPLPVTGTGSGWVSIPGAGYQTCGVKVDRTLWCWGANDDGPLGQGDYVQRGTPTQVGSGTTWLRMSVGEYSVCATKSDTTLWCWGYDGDGRLATGSQTSVPVPTQVSGTGWTSVAVGFASGCATKTDSSVWFWGYKEWGSVGNGLSGSANNTSSPVQVAGSGWTSVSMRGYHVCATKQDRTLWCWGRGDAGQMGNGTFTAKNPTPTQVPGTTWDRAHLGSWHACATKTDKSLWCWGHNGCGEVGVGDYSDRSTPQQLGLGAVAGSGAVPSPTLSSPAAAGTRIYPGDYVTYTISPTQSFEAEQSAIAGDARISPTVRASASGGRSVGGHFSGNSMTWTVNAPAAGSCTVRVCYAASQAQTQNLVVNGASRTLNYVNTGDFTTFRPSQDVSVTVSLNNGANTIALSSTGDVFFEIDRITVTPS